MEEQNNPEKQGENRGNDTTWKPGQSGNPQGRPKKERCIPEILARIGSEGIENDPLIPDEIKKKILKCDNDVEKLEAVLRMVYVFAIKGQSWAVNFIAERTEGKAPQTIKLRQEHVIIDIIEDEEDGDEETEIININKGTYNG